MNIKEAKQEIIRTVQAYLAKDETGTYEIPTEKQRPILLMGPPGIGKTAIVEQAADECGINLVSYTITHHTRQSMIGLPFISRRLYGGKEYSVTEYTMSEIVASIYDRIEQTGISEGILFLDEINCVSETLAPTMLQFLQYKTFGTHRIPEGFVIVTAGNPPQYNKSVRDFDIVTLDRLRKIDIQEDYSAWKEYAYRAGVHGAIMAYLEIKKENFYKIKADLDGRRFVTARGWEDLSRVLYTYEKLKFPVTENLVIQYLQDAEVAEDFAVYYELYNKYRNLYRIPEILDGIFPENTGRMEDAPFDEKLSLLSLMMERLHQEFYRCAADLEVQKALFGSLKETQESLRDTKENVSAIIERQTAVKKEELQKKTEANLLNREDAKNRRREIQALQELQRILTLGEPEGEAEDPFSPVRSWFQDRENRRVERVKQTGDHLTNSFAFLERTFGVGQEIVIFLSELTADYYSVKYVSEWGNEAYYKYNKLLLLKDRRAELKQDIMKLM